MWYYSVAKIYVKNASSMKEKIKLSVKDYMPELINIRRHIHQHPELSFAEHQTMVYISEQLDAAGIEHLSGVANTGVVGVLGDGAGKCIGLRADIDALPMYEKTDAAYASVNEGVMHACGHDVHTTCLLGALKTLKQFEDELPGRVKFVFQPAEEKLPGGARDIIAAGVMTDTPAIDIMLGLHVHPPLEVGTLGFKSGMFMASADELTITFRGKGGHAAVPIEFVDPIVAASTFITQVQQIVSRRADPSIPTVISFGHIETKGGSFNIIPEEVVIKGTLRTMDETWRATALELITETASHLAAAGGCSAETNIIHGYPYLLNDPNITPIAKAVCQDLFGADQVVDLPFRMSAEDFARYAQIVPSVFYRIGVANQKRGITAPVHSPYFDVDEDAIFYGASSMAYLAHELMSVDS